MNDFFSIVRRYLLEYLPTQRCLSENTIKSYRQGLNLFVSFLREVLHIPTSRISFADCGRDNIIGFLDWLGAERGCGATSLNQRLMILRSFLKYAGETDCAFTALSFEAASLPVRKAKGRIVEFLSEPALKALLSAPNPAKRTEYRNRFFMILMYDTAARCGELINLRLRDLRIYDKHPVASLRGKGNKTRIVPLLPETVEHCQRYLQAFHPNIARDSYDNVFYTSSHGNHNPMSADTVALFMRKYGDLSRRNCPEFPERLHPHMLRHTRAMHLYQQGMPLHLLSEYLGHVNFETTKVYAYADAEMKRAAITKADALREGSPAADLNMG